MLARQNVEMPQIAQDAGHPVPVADLLAYDLQHQGGQFPVGPVILFLIGAIWQTAMLGLAFGILVSTILFASALLSPPLSLETD